MGQANPVSDIGLVELSLLGADHGQNETSSLGQVTTAAPATVATPANEASRPKFKDAERRVVKIDGKPWFVARDVPALLGLTRDNLKVNLGLAEKR